ncbi:MAG: potassium channel family protein [Nitrospiraceae bacterium]|nr:potassium channel family protein [Nitrospiraceae bacterium]
MICFSQAPESAVFSGGWISVVVSAVGVALVLVILWDAFESIVLPRRVTRQFRLTAFFYRSAWLVWSKLVSYVRRSNRQETLLSYFGPLSLLMLLSIWATGLILGFALMNWGINTPVRTGDGSSGFLTYLYLSGTTFFTLGLGDVAPVTSLARMMTAVEAGLGFGFLALVIGYLPALNQSFSRREINISLLDARAGSPPTAAELLLRRCHDAENMDALLQHLSEWERWTAEVLESHLSYPVLAYFRSQHDNQSWLAALTTILDASAFVMVATEGPCARQAQLTFAIARHAVVDISLVFNRPPLKPRHDRLSAKAFSHLWQSLIQAGLPLKHDGSVEHELAELRRLYEPYLNGLAVYFRLQVPPWFFESARQDNWMKSAWERRRGLRGGFPPGDEDEHF